MRLLCVGPFACARSACDSDRLHDLSLSIFESLEYFVVCSLVPWPGGRVFIGEATSSTTLLLFGIKWWQHRRRGCRLVPGMPVRLCWFDSSRSCCSLSAIFSSTPFYPVR
jgi:hypothetical protein